LKKEFIYNIFFLLTINLLVKPLYIFGVEATIHNQVINYGLYFVFFNLVTQFQFINDPGIQNYNSIFIANNKSTINDYFPRLMGLKLFIFPVFSLIVLLAAMILGYDWRDYHLLFGVISMLFLMTLFFLLRTSMSAYEYYRVDTWLSSLDRFFLIIILGYFILTKYPMSLELFVWTQVACYSLCVLIAFYFLLKLKIDIKPKIDFSFITTFLKDSWPYAIIILLTSVIAKVDGVMLERLSSDGLKIAGEYGTGIRFIDAANMFGVLFGGLLLPMFSNRLVSNESIQDVFALAYRLLLPLSLIAGCTFYFYANEVFGLIYKQELLNNLPAMKILLLSTIPILLSNAMGPIILATKRISTYNIVLSIAAIFMIISNYIFIPKYGIMASSIIELCTWSIILISLIFISQNSKAINFRNDSLIPKSILIIIVTFLAYYTFTFVDLFWIVEMMLVPIIIVVIAFITKYFSIHEILKSK
jgi:O-antigen/teichoic acid export membrane protein